MMLVNTTAKNLSNKGKESDTNNNHLLKAQWKIRCCIAICLLILCGTFLPHEKYGVFVQAIQKLTWGGLVLVGISLHKPNNWNFWLCVSLYFFTTGVRNIYRVSIYFQNGKWIYAPYSKVEIIANSLAAIFLITASIILMRGRRPSGEWWALADAWVIGIAIFIIGLYSVTFPLYIKEGMSWTFINHGVVIVLRAVFIIVPVLAILLTERIRAASFYIYSIGVILMFLSDYFLDALLQTADIYNWVRSTTIIIQGIAQTLLVISALIPSMRDMISPLHNPRPPWSWLRTFGMSIAVLSPIAVMKFSNQLDHQYRDIIYLCFCILLLSLIFRNRLAILTAARTQLAIEHLAYHDELTGLPNRYYLNTVLVNDIKANIDQNTKLVLACCYIDLDGLKYINDQFGHHVGDQMITALAASLKKLPPHWNHNVLRIGSDEFAVLIPMVFTLTHEQIYDVGEKIRDTILNELQYKNNNLLSSSLGIAQITFIAQGQSTPIEYIEKKLNKLLGYADLAQVHAKRSGGNKVKVYSEEMGTETNRFKLSKISIY